MLLVASVVALVWANVLSESYDVLGHTLVGIRLDGWSFVRPVEFWINYGAMTVFFLLVGLEIRRAPSG